MTKFELFESNYHEALSAINDYCISDNLEMKHIANWLMMTKANPYGIFCSEDISSLMGSAEGMSGLLSSIEHALTDDGDISFPVINGSPKISFRHKEETDVEKHLLSNVERSTHKRMGLKPTVMWLDNVFEFTKNFDLAYKSWLKRAFMTDATLQSIDFAVKHYANNEEYKGVFEEEWIIQAKKKINKVSL